MKSESRYSIYGNGETVNVDTLSEAYEIAEGMAVAFGHSVIFDNLTKEKIEDFSF
jgi:hypothetical protein